MKKSILIALAVAVATCAQGQVDEWVNPFKEYGAFNYVQKQSEHETSKWFLITSSLNDEKYPTLVNYNNETFVCMSDSYYALAIVLKRPYDLDKRYINVDLKYNAIHLNGNREKTDNDFLTARVSFINLIGGEKEKDLFENIERLEEHTSNYTSYLYSSANGTLVTTSGNSKYICIVLSGTNKNESGYCLINNIEITIRDSEYNSGYDPNNKVFKNYFYEPYYMDENGNIHSKNESVTSINDMESNTYVSNNVLHTDEPSSVYIFNAGGILVKTENNTTSVDLSDLKKGVYIAKVNEKTIKFVR